MKIVRMRVDSNLPETIEIENSLKALQEQVGGYIEEISILELKNLNVVCFGDEEGRLKGKKPNLLVNFGKTLLVGDLIFCGNGEDGELRDLEPFEINSINRFINTAK